MAASHHVRRMLRWLMLLLPCALAACGGGGGPRLTYGIPTSAPAEYRPPGPATDPWGPYIQEAAARFEVPERWIRAVMRQESGGHQYLHGQLTTSSAGAMGLMQLTAQTYGDMRDRYHLGSDPYDPHDNIMAGTAYIRHLYRIYGSPAFLAAYDAGPKRLERYMAGRASLPDETVNYLASVAPTLGNHPPMSGPLAVYGGQAGEVELAAADPPAPVEQAPLPSPVAQTPPAPQPRRGFSLIESAEASPLPPSRVGRGWGVQVGAFANPIQAREAAVRARSAAADLLMGTQITVPATLAANGNRLFRARLLGLSAQSSEQACGELSGYNFACLAVPPGG